jgi:predicted ATPase
MGSAGVLPSGTVTFLFTDIEGSTRLWEQFAEAMGVALALHDELLRSAIDAHGGVVFATGGDGVAAAFGRAGDAVAAAVDAQRALQGAVWPDGVGLRVRMGAHTGEAEERDGDYFGPPVNRAARLMSAAHGGQVVVSEATAAVLGAPTGVRLVDLGSHRLKGVVDEMRVFGVDADGLGWLDRGLVTEQVVPGNLPRPATEYVGRVDVLQERAVGLSDRRLVTLTGTGGVGKTRTAVEVGWLLTDAYPGGLWLVELAPIADEGMVVAAVGSALGVSLQPGMSMTASIVESLQGRRMLLILDNCEHVMSPVVELVSAITVNCELVTVLATSREPLGVPGERVVPVPSMDIDSAVELFVERAQAADESLGFDTEDRVVIGEICQRLDGIPLAIELAAARVRSFTLRDLAGRLDDRFRLLRGSGRGGLERHQTLRAAVAWSYQLLGEAERVVFDRVSVFAGGFDLEAAEAVCGGDDIDVDDVVELLSSLVDKSMLIADRSDRSVRYVMLETLRQFGEERLTDSGHTAMCRDRHLAHYLEVASAMRLLQMGPRQLEGDVVFEREWDNIRAAQAWAIAAGNLGAADELIYQSGAFAFLRQHHEFTDWVDRLVAVASADFAPSSRAFMAGGALLVVAADHDRAIEFDTRGIEQNSDPASVAMCWFQLMLVLFYLGRVDEALAASHEAEAAVALTDDPYANYWVSMGIAAFAATTEPAAWPAAVDKVVGVAEQYRAPWMIIGAEQARANARYQDGDYEGALQSGRSAYRLAIEIGSVVDEVIVGQGVIAALLAPPDAVLTSECRNIFARMLTTSSWSSIWAAVEVIANNLARTDNPQAAAIIIGHLDRQVDTTWYAQTTAMRQLTLDLVGLDDHADDWMATGAAMTRDEIAAYTLDQLPE